MPDEMKNDQVAELPPAPQAVAPNSPEAMRQLFGEGKADRFITFDPKTPEGIALLDKCEETADEPLRTLSNLELRLQHVYAHLVDIVNKETGEVVPRLRTCLITTEGKVHACVSDGIRDAVLRLALQHGLPPWPKGIPVKVLLRPTKTERIRMTLVNVVEPAKKGGAK